MRQSPILAGGRKRFPRGEKERRKKSLSCILLAAGVSMVSEGCNWSATESDGCTSRRDVGVPRLYV